MDITWDSIETADDLRLGEVMPAWFAGRMMADRWCFGLLLSSGHTMLVERIDAIHVSNAGIVLLDVEMCSAPADAGPIPGTPLPSPTGRSRATVNLAHVVAAFELADGDNTEE
ncbi:hypothetical protein [Roseomonas sp. BN140053]|uniref:hypothetical protein n=1 Tax=Roseomonas sp. BN140053 TaxID=3391898 RepID=UPI0039ED6070